ncbi:MAG TPA: YidC/Oxa1 family insertase periplasmic-domain containing protein [Pyrinomonadaceae bacterium]
MEQKRLLLAFALSAAILFGWSFFISSNAPRTQNANDPATAGATPSPAQADAAQPATAQTNPSAAFNDNAPRRTVTVRTPLYEAKFDSRGAVATSWVMLRNQHSGLPLYSVAGDRTSRQPLELIPSEQDLKSVPENIRQEARATPLRLVTGDANFDALLAANSYRVTGVEGDGGDAKIEIKPGETRSVGFTLRDEASGTEVVKNLTFSADSYSVGLDLKLTRGGQIVPAAKLAVGPSIGDQGVPYYTFYSVAPEAVASVNGSAQIFYGANVHTNEGSPDRQVVGGTIDWAAIGDTYFAMAAVPPKPSDAFELRTAKYEHDVDGSKEERFLITALLNVPADGSTTRIFVGPKDHNILTTASAEMNRALPGRAVDLEGLINYGSWLGFISRPLAAPILWSFERLYNLTNSYGIAIIIFTFLIYSLFFPLKWRSSKAMKKAQKMAPKMKELQEKIKGMKQNDPRLKELQMEQLRLMKEGNPLGGCLPLLIQMPFLIAVYSAITVSLDFRQASFLWLPDLSAADPYKLLPILMAGSMVILQFITPAPSADPLQRKMMAIMMPAFMLYILWSAPSGLLVYWIVGNFVGFGQQMLINRLVKSEDDEQPQPPPKKNETKRAKKLGDARVSEA